MCVSERQEYIGLLTIVYNQKCFISFNITKNVFLKNNKCVCVCVLYFNLSKNIFLCKFKYRTQTHFKEIKDFFVY